MRKLAFGLASIAVVMASPALARDGSPYAGIEFGAMKANRTKIDVGNVADAVDIKYRSKFPSKLGWDGDIFLGYDFGHFRLEGEVSKKRAKIQRVTTLVTLPGGALPGTYAAGGHTDVTSYMLNGEGDFGPDDSVSFFAGGGVGYANVKLSGLQGEIERLHREIAALGAVNLAALDELTTARERKHFLDAQSADLNEAMVTLEDAIRKIDAETRELLAGTFNTVNEHFGKMFPELFGGGNARLVMTGDEILDSGVQVMAQPPGKKNQTIHLLSGGEKALTATALVFAIFQLNPAPFCLLDEVDAPLDDANTERYAKLVTSMSRETQFLFISHNKIAMEMAEQLIGVTMQEQGVSRIVAVDMESAVSMAEAA